MSEEVEGEKVVEVGKNIGVEGKNLEQNDTEEQKDTKETTDNTDEKTANNTDEKPADIEEVKTDEKTALSPEDIFIKYLSTKSDKAEAALKEKKNKKIEEDEKEFIEILDKTITDSEASSDKTKKILMDYYYAEKNNDITQKDAVNPESLSQFNGKRDIIIKEKNEILIKQLKTLIEKYTVKSNTTDTKENLEKKSNDINKRLSNLKDTFNRIDQKQIFKEFVKKEKPIFENLKLKNDFDNFSNNIENMIKDIKAKENQ